MPYFLRITSSDPSLLKKIEPASISVQLIQRCAVSKCIPPLGTSQTRLQLTSSTTVSHGAPGVQENVVADGQTVPAEDTNPDSAETTRRFKGSLQLSRAPATSFRSYNIEVSVSLLLLESYVSVPYRISPYLVSYRL